MKKGASTETVSDEQPTSFLSTLAIVGAAAILFLVTSLALFFAFPRNTEEDWKAILGLIGIAGTFIASMTTVALTARNLSIQIKANTKLEQVKYGLTENTELLKRRLDIQKAAYDSIYLATSKYYHALQKLAQDQFDTTLIENAEQTMVEARGLSNYVSDDVRRNFIEFFQRGMNVVDEARQMQRSETQFYQKLWERNAANLGEPLNALRDFNPFT